MDGEAPVRQRILIEDRTQVSIDGVRAVRAFDGQVLMLETAGGEVTVEGEELRLEDLDKSSGELVICGRILGVFYERPRPQRRGPRAWFS